MANVVRQKARSTIRCIKTLLPFLLETPVATGQKARSTIRCIKTLIIEDCATKAVPGQKVRSTIRCIKTGRRGVILHHFSRSDSTERHKVH